MNARRLLIVVNSDWFFLSHRLPIAKAARERGYDVHIAAIDTGQGKTIEQEGLRFHPLPLTTSGTNPFRELWAIFALFRLYRKIRPDIVHHVTIKPILYGSLVAWLFPGMRVVNAVSGLGYMFTDAARAKVLRPVIRFLYRLALGHPRSAAIFQNREDRERFVAADMLPAERAVLIRGSGVDPEVFAKTPEPDQDPPVVLLSSRLIWDKGIGEFVEAARMLAGKGIRARFILVGRPDTGNPRAVPVAQLERWVEEGVVEWWGHRADMPAVLAAANLVVLPTRYPEGVPRALIEAASVGRAIVTTDSPGCRDIVEHEVSGILVSPGDTNALASAIERLLGDPALRRRYGENGAFRVRRDFTVQKVVEAHLSLYRSVLDEDSVAASSQGEGELVAIH